MDRRQRMAGDGGDFRRRRAGAGEPRHGGVAEIARLEVGEAGNAGGDRGRSDLREQMAVMIPDRADEGPRWSSAMNDAEVRNQAHVARRYLYSLGMPGLAWPRRPDGGAYPAHFR